MNEHDLVYDPQIYAGLVTQKTPHLYEMDFKKSLICSVKCCYSEHTEKILLKIELNNLEKNLIVIILTDTAIAI